MISSKYQAAIYDYIKNGTGNAVIQAVAGGGKTTTAVESLNCIDKKKKALFLAFNKSIAETLQARVPKNVKASTIHSFGFSMCKRLIPDAAMEANKVYLWMQELAVEECWDIPKDGRTQFFTRVNKLVDLMRLTLSTTEEQCIDLCDQFDVEYENGEIDAAMQTFQKVIKDDDSFDFVDMIYIPATRAFEHKGFDFVFVDEFQDCCLAQLEFVKKLVAKNGRLIVIGDRHQSIYGYIGSSPKIFDEVMKMPNTVELPLSVSYRCSKAVIRHAQQIVPHIEARDDAPEGSVVMNGSIHNVKAGDFVLCRTNAPLVSLCMEYIKDGVKAYIKGADIGRNLISFVKNYEKLSTKEALEKIHKRRDKMEQKFRKKFPDKAIDSIPEFVSFLDRVNVIEVLSAETKTVKEIITKIQTIYSDDNREGIILSTVHKSKGLEAKNVFIVEPQLIPFPFGMNRDWMIEQENNLDYVARTRAIEKLEYIRDWSSFKPKTMGKKLKVISGVAQDNVDVIGSSARDLDEQGDEIFLDDMPRTDVEMRTPGLGKALDAVLDKAMARSNEEVPTRFMPSLPKDPNQMVLLFK